MSFHFKDQHQILNLLRLISTELNGKTAAFTFTHNNKEYKIEHYYDAHVHRTAIYTNSMCLIDVFSKSKISEHHAVGMDINGEGAFRKYFTLSFSKKHKENNIKIVHSSESTYKTPIIESTYFIEPDKIEEDLFAIQLEKSHPVLNFDRSFFVDLLEYSNNMNELGYTKVTFYTSNTDKIIEIFYNELQKYFKV